MIVWEIAWIKKWWCAELAKYPELAGWVREVQLLPFPAKPHPSRQLEEVSLNQ